MKALKLILNIIVSVATIIYGFIMLFQISKYMFENANVGLAFHEFGLFGLFMATLSLVISNIGVHVFSAKSKKIIMSFSVVYLFFIMAMFLIVNAFSGWGGIVSTIAANLFIILVTLVMKIGIKKSCDFVSLKYLHNKTS